MTPEAASAFVKRHGVVLAAARGPVPSIAERIAGAPIRGSWWGHPRGREIFRTLEHLSASSDVLVCRLVGGKVSLVHRRLWPALVRIAAHFPARSVSQVHQVHTEAGMHRSHDVPFPDWVPAPVTAAARKLSEAEAFQELGGWATPKPKAARRRAPARAPARRPA